MTIITDIDLPKDDILKAIWHAQVIAKRNRCQSWNKRIIIISGNLDHIQDYGHPKASIKNEHHGVCWTGHPMSRFIYIRPGRSRADTVITLCHELAHAFTNPNAAHSYSWRSLYLLYFATLPRIFDFDYNGWTFLDEIHYARDRYETRGYTPLKRHLNAMDRMLTWYTNNVENSSAHAHS